MALKRISSHTWELTCDDCEEEIKKMSFETGVASVRSSVFDLMNAGDFKFGNRFICDSCEYSMKRSQDRHMTRP